MTRKCGVCVFVQLFLHMCECGIQADAVTCCSLINAMDRAGLWQVAELVLLALCARMPSFRDMRALPALDLSSFLDASEQALVHTLVLRLSGDDAPAWPDPAADASPLSCHGTRSPSPSVSSVHVCSFNKRVRLHAGSPDPRRLPSLSSLHTRCS